MKQEDIYQIRINQTVRVKLELPLTGFFIATVKSINDHTKRIGVYDCADRFKEYPLRRIMPFITDISKINNLRPNKNKVDKKPEYWYAYVDGINDVINILTK